MLYHNNMVATQQMCLRFRPDNNKKITTEVEYIICKHGDRTLTYLRIRHGARGGAVG
jgi:hypothetical protein